MPSIVLNTNKRVCFWGALAHLPIGMRTIKDCMREVGTNTGNVFIGNGLFSATNAPIKEYWNFYFGTPEEFDERFDVLFVPASNFIFPFTDLTDQFEFFRKTKAQIFMFGLGSQLREIGPISIPIGTENFIRLAADRGTSIGVRGEITADVVGRMGIKNVQVTGCPSMLSVPDTFTASPDLNDPKTKISGNFTNNSREHAFSEHGMKRLESALFAELLEHDGYYVLQNEEPEIDLMGRLPYVDALEERDLYSLRCIKSLFDLKLPSNEGILNFMRWNVRLFFSVYEWKTFMKDVDFSFGTRFHGNVAAIVAGRPAHFFCHDYRTLELAQFYKLPHSVVDAHSRVPTLAEILQDTEMALFSANIPKLMAIWFDFISQNGFEAQTLP